MRRVAVDEVDARRVIAAIEGLPLAYVGGRQGGGYLKASLDDVRAVDGLRGPLLRLEALLGHPPAVDRYWLVYPTGSSIGAHTDPCPADGLVHLRANLVVDVGDGGDFQAGGRTVDLGVGDAVVFRPDVVVHAVSTVTRGTRRVLSVGTVMSAEAAAAVLAALEEG